MTLFEIADGDSAETHLHPTDCAFCGDNNLQSFAYHDRCDTCGHVEQHNLGEQYLPELVLDGVEFN